MSMSKRLPTSAPTPRPAAPPEPPPLSTYALAKLYHLWSQAALPPEQMVGHLLQHQIDQEQRLHRLEQALQIARKST